MSAAEEPAVCLQAVSHDPAPAVSARGRQHLNRAFEAVEGMGFSGHHDFERLVVIVSTQLTGRHGVTLSGKNRRLRQIRLRLTRLPMDTRTTRKKTAGSAVVLPWRGA